MPLMEFDGTKVVTLGAGDVSITTIVDMDNGYRYLTFAPMDNEHPLDAELTHEEAWKYVPSLMIAFMNKAGFDNVIRILQKVSDEWEAE